MSSETSTTEQKPKDSTPKIPEEPKKDGSGDATTTTSTPKPPVQGRKYEGITKLRNFLKERRTELVLYFLRIATVFFVLLSITPFIEPTDVFVRRALIANVLSSGVRLYQRVSSTFTFSKEGIARLVVEDAFHYVCFTMIFLLLGQQSPALLSSLISITLLASLHVASFTLHMLESVKGPRARICAVGSLLHFWTFKTGWVLRLAAISEIMCFGLILLGAFRGTNSLIMPFVYYRFITFRYASRRNPYTRMVFREMRQSSEKFMASGNCPGLLKNIIGLGITLLCKVAPPTAPNA